jgi:hypothetical protein
LVLAGLSQVPVRRLTRAWLAVSLFSAEAWTYLPGRLQSGLAVEREGLTPPHRSLPLLFFPPQLDKT